MSPIAQSRLSPCEEHEVVLVFADLDDSTAICNALGEYWAHFLDQFYCIVEQRADHYAQYGAERHKYIGDSALFMFHPRLAKPPRHEDGVEPMVEIAYSFLTDLYAYLGRWVAMANEPSSGLKWSEPLRTFLAAKSKPLTLVASIALGCITPFEKVSADGSSIKYSEIAGLTIHRAQRLMKIHDLLPQNNVFVTKKCFNLLLEFFPEDLVNRTDIQLRGFPEWESVYSGKLPDIAEREKQIIRKNLERVL